MTPYIIEPNQMDAMRRRMDEYVSICKEIALKHQCILVDFQRLYDAYCQVRHSSFFTWDRIHPNQKGAKLMAKEILRCCEFDYYHEWR